MQNSARPKQKLHVLLLLTLRFSHELHFVEQRRRVPQDTRRGLLLRGGHHLREAPRRAAPHAPDRSWKGKTRAFLGAKLPTDAISAPSSLCVL
jgi:hypothetical protein